MGDTVYSDLQRVRLDGGGRQFRRRWGYDQQSNLQDAALSGGGVGGGGGSVQSAALEDIEEDLDDFSDTYSLREEQQGDGYVPVPGEKTPTNKHTFSSKNVLLYYHVAGYYVKNFANQKQKNNGKGLKNCSWCQPLASTHLNFFFPRQSAIAKFGIENKKKKLNSVTAGQSRIDTQFLFLPPASLTPICLF